ncbi:MAG TPA: nitroreductase family protein [Terriglobales bacterium]|nr:nitroreductase family protein [Terriglobales bacterium]
MSSNSGPLSPAGFEYPVHELIAKRFSGRAFSSKPVDAATVGSLLEAARWAASCSNEQPWSFIVTGQEQRSDYERLLGCLVEFNVEWAQHAPVLILSIARLNFASSGKPNRHALHDVGQATANLQLQATALGLFAHPMAGFDLQKARREFQIPESHEPVAVIAVGYRGDPANLSEKLRQKEVAPRQRKAQREFVFRTKWGQP